MRPKTRGLMIGVGGLIAGAVVANFIDLPTLPKAGIVLAVCGAVSMVLWLVLRPRGTAH